MSVSHLSLALTYALCFFTSGSYVALLPSMRTELQACVAESARLVGLGAAGSATGKLLYSGWMVDRLGARPGIAAALVMAAIAALALSRANSFYVVLVCGPLTEFFTTAVWPAHVQLVRLGSTVTEDEDRGIWMLGIASRLGAVCSQLAFGLAEGALGWRAAEHGTFCIGMTAALYVMLRPSSDATRVVPESETAILTSPRVSEAQHPPKDLHTKPPMPAWRLLRKIASSHDFWLATAGTACLGTVKRSGELMVGVFLVDATAPGVLSTGSAIGLAASFAAGVGFSVLVAGRRFSAAEPAGKLRLMRTLNALSTFALLLLAADAAAGDAASSAHVVARAALCAAAGVGLGVSFYLPPGLLAIRFGGRSAGVVSSYIDGFSYLAIFFASLLISSLAQVPDLGWSAVWLFLALLYGVGTSITAAYLARMLAGSVRPLEPQAAS